MKKTSTICWLILSRLINKTSEQVRSNCFGVLGDTFIKKFHLVLLLLRKTFNLLYSTKIVCRSIEKHSNLRQKKDF